MHYQLIRDTEGERTFALVFDSGEEAMEGLRTFAWNANLVASQLTAIGALSDVTLGFFDPETRRYEKTRLWEQVEVLSLLGNVAIHENRPQVHAHVVVGKRDGSAHGGHLLAATVRPTLEVIVTESPRHLRRRLDPSTGLTRLDLEEVGV
jgi:uncharacterized protein